MDTLALIDKRIRHRLERINAFRLRNEKEEVRCDLDTPLRGYLQLREEFEYRFRLGLQVKPLLVVKVTYRNHVYYFDVPGVGYHDPLYETLKHPPGRDEKRSETYWLTDELDIPLEAIEKHMEEVLA